MSSSRSGWSKEINARSCSFTVPSGEHFLHHSFSHTLQSSCHDTKYLAGVPQVPYKTLSGVTAKKLGNIVVPPVAYILCDTFHHIHAGFFAFDDNDGNPID